MFIHIPIDCFLNQGPLLCSRIASGIKLVTFVTLVLAVKVHRLFFFLIAFIIFRITDQIVYRIYVDWKLPDIFSHNCTMIISVWKRTAKIKCYFHHTIHNSWVLYWFAMAVITEYLRLGSLKKEIYFSYSSGGWI